MPTLTIPDPCLVVLVGPAGSGKSTLAARGFGPAEVLSSDAMRAIVGRGEADQKASKAAFALLHRHLAERLGRGELTVVDATNLEAHARRALLQRARAARVPAVAIVLDLPPPLIRERSRGRSSRLVGRDVVEMHLARLRHAVDRGVLEQEGFATIYRIRNPAEVEALEIVRTPDRPR